MLFMPSFFWFRQGAQRSRIRIFSAFFFGIAVSIFFVSLSAAGALNDTGQTRCYDATALTVVACDDAHVGDVSQNPRQDARFGRDAAQAAGMLPAKTGGGSAGFDFSRICNDGSDCSTQTATGIYAGEWGCTRDNVTGLMWEMKTTTGGSPRDQLRFYSWYDSTIADPVERGEPGNIVGCGDTLGGANCNTENYVNSINAAGLCGRNDWRLPTRRELLSIVDYDGVGAIDTDYFPNTNVLNPTGFYWTVESDVLAPNRAWYVHFQYGNSVPSVKIGTTMGVRLVRGALPAASFQDNGDGTVSDAATGLMWDQCAIGQRTTGSGCAAAANAAPLTWQQALTAAVVSNEVNYLGYNDWRLPNVKELESLIAIDSPVYINQVAFPQTPADAFWSSTTFVVSPFSGWYVDFGHGNVSYLGNYSDTRMARLVRGGQVFASFDLLGVNSVTLSVTATGETNALLTVTVDRASTGYWLVLPAGSVMPTTAQLAAGASGSLAANTAASFGLSGLVPDTAYDLWFVARVDSNYSAIRKTSFTMPSATPPSPPSPPPSPSACSVVDGALLGPKCVYSVSQGAENLPVGFCIAAGESVTVSIDGAYYQLGADTPTACFEAVASGRPAYSGTGPGRGLLPVSGNARVTAAYPESVVIVARNGDIVTALTEQAGIRTRVNADCTSLSIVKNGGEIAAPAWMLASPPAGGCPSDALTPPTGAFAASGALACPKGENLAITDTFRRLSLAPTFAPGAGQRIFFAVRLPATDGNAESWFQFAGGGWQPLTDPIATAGTAPGGEISPWVLRYLDVGGLPSGTELYLGYGDDADEMSVNRRYCGLFRIAP